MPWHHPCLEAIEEEGEISHFRWAGINDMHEIMPGGTVAASQKSGWAISGTVEEGEKRRGVVLGW